MSGANESPRQKLIGMMYLVLTALLALQVSSAIIDKFDFLNKSLEMANLESNAANVNMLSSVKETVDKSGNRPKDVEVLKKAEQVRNETSKLIAELAAIKTQMIVESGGTDAETGHYLGAKEETKVETLMVGANKSGKAYELKTRLNKYADYLSEVSERKGKEKFKPLAQDASEIPSLKNDIQKNKDFAELNFAQTPMVAALAVLSQKQAEITRYESDVLEHLAGKVGADQIKFETAVAMVKPESKYVAAGTKYKAELFIAASNSTLNPVMKVDGRIIPVQGGMGIVDFTATPGNYDADGNAKKTFTAEITIPTPSGDSTFKNTVEYFVTKPVIQIQSAALSALYQDCGNQLNVQVPALGNSYNPTFNGTSGAVAIPGSKKGFVTIVPSAGSKEVILNVNSNGNLIGTEKFKVKAVPRPEIKVKIGGKDANLKVGEPASSVRAMKLIADISDESFKQNLPDDARYKVAQWEITLARGSRPVLPTIKVSDDNVNLATFAAQAKPGDRLVIEVKAVKRMNFKGAILDVPISTSSSIITITLN